MKKITLLFFINLCVLFSSCKKAAGEGGTSTITGKVWAEDWNTAFTVKNGEYNATDEDVYIIYGDDLSYGDKTKTNYNGEFSFKYLRKGKYRVYVYSKDKTLTSQSGDIALVKDIEISDNKQITAAETFTIYK